MSSQEAWNLHLDNLVGAKLKWGGLKPWLGGLALTSGLYYISYWKNLVTLPDLVMTGAFGVQVKTKTRIIFADEGNNK